MIDEVLKFISRSNKNWTIYSPFRFLPKIINDENKNEFLIDRIKQLSLEKTTTIFKAEVLDLKHYFIISQLEWDTNYFGFPIYKIEYIIYDHQSLDVLCNAVNQFSTFTCKFRNSYFFIDIPSEDILLVQSLGNTPFRLVETRLNYIMKDFSILDSVVSPVRIAKEEDIPFLRNVSMQSVNPYDRVHADSSFSNAQADEYLGTFIENAVKGFADVVLVPDLPQLPPFAFLAFNKPVVVNNFKISKLVLAASDSSVQKGWLFKLLVEAIRMLNSEGITHMSTITQVSNIAAVKSWEKAGFDYCFCTHILSFKTK